MNTASPMHQKEEIPTPNRVSSFLQEDGAVSRV